MTGFKRRTNPALRSALAVLAVIIPCASAHAEFDTVTRNLNKQPTSRLLSPDRPLIDPSSNKHMHKPSDEFNLPRPDLRPGIGPDTGPPLSDLPRAPHPVTALPSLAN